MLIFSFLKKIFLFDIFKLFEIGCQTTWTAVQTQKERNKKRIFQLLEKQYIKY